MDYGSVLEVLKKVNPKYIFHIASHANVRDSFDNPVSVFDNNTKGTLNLLDAVRRLNQKPIIQICSTSEVYGNVDEKDVPIKENCPINPASVYAVSKLAQDYLGLVYFKNYGIPVVRTRMFSYLNPRRKDLFATSFAIQIAEIEGKQERDEANRRRGILNRIKKYITSNWEIKRKEKF